MPLASLGQAKVTEASGKNRGPCWAEKLVVLCYGEMLLMIRGACGVRAPGQLLLLNWPVVAPLNTQAQDIVLLLGWRGFKGEAVERSHRCSSFLAPCSQQGSLPWVNPASPLPSLPLRGP